MRQRHFVGRLSGSEAKRFCAVVRLLTSFEISDYSSKRFLDLLDSPAWHRLPRLSCTVNVEPLIKHNVERLSLSFEDVFDMEENPFLPSPPDLEQLVQQYYQRRKRMTELLEGLTGECSGPILVLKGFATAENYPTPALRTMEDVDVACWKNEQDTAERVLLAQGWKRSAAGWHHDSGVSADVHFLSKSHPFFGNSAKTKAVFSPSESVFVQTPAYALLTIAQHSAKHRAVRIWRDRTDFRAIMRSRDIGEVLPSTEELARRTGLLPEFSALARYAGFEVELPDEAQDIARLQSALSVDRITEAGFAALGKKVSQRTMPKGKTPGTLEAVQRDPILGSESRSSRHWSKAALGIYALVSGQYSHYGHLTKLARRVRAQATERGFDF